MFLTPDFWFASLAEGTCWIETDSDIGLLEILVDVSATQIDIGRGFNTFDRMVQAFGNFDVDLFATADSDEVL